ncbi:MAG TPA: hypothetical protein VMC79_00345 [Rectinemataceae bacterium]|nr:hypothetical protein [Rectinemataceae bacterium]
MNRNSIAVRFAELSRIARAAGPEASLRLALLHDEVLRLPPTSAELQVLSGRAWVSQNGEDYILDRGERLFLAASRQPAVISGLGDETLFFETR